MELYIVISLITIVTMIGFYFYGKSQKQSEINEKNIQLKNKFDELMQEHEESKENHAYVDELLSSMQKRTKEIMEEIMTNNYTQDYNELVKNDSYLNELIVQYKQLSGKDISFTQDKSSTI